MRGPDLLAKVMNSRWQTLLVIAICTALIAACGSIANGPVHMQALWYGHQSDGQLDSGVADVTATTSADPDSTTFVVDTSELAANDTDQIWVASAKTAAMVAVLARGIEPQGLTIKYGVDGPINGPSAGALMAAGTMADLVGGRLDPDSTITGTILPNGAIGEVGGIPEKIRAAAAAGLTKVLIPRGQATAFDPQDHTEIDVVGQGKELGVEVIEVDTIAQAVDQVSGDSTAVARSKPPRIDESVNRISTRAATASLAWLKTGKATIAPTTPSLADSHKSLTRAKARAIRQVPNRLARGNSTIALAQATFTRRAINSWNARMTTTAQAQRQGIKRTTRSLLAAARKLVESIQKREAQIAATPVNKVEQLTALAETLGWASDAKISANAISTQLTTTTPSISELGQMSSDLTQLAYNTTTIMPVSAQVALAIGDKDITDVGALLSSLNTYSEFMAQASEANIEYHKNTPARTDDNYEEQRARAAATEFSRLPHSAADQARVLIRLATANTYWVSSSILVASLGMINESRNTDTEASRYLITDKASFEKQLAISQATGKWTAEALAAENTDSSYMRWNLDWGLALGLAPDFAGANGQIHREGLGLMWSALINGNINRAIANNSEDQLESTIQ